MPPLRRALHTVRSATTLAPARPAYAAGLRAAIATVVPLAVAAAFAPTAGTWLSIGGFNGALSDRGGPYRSRAATMLVLMATSAVTIVLGTLAGGHIAAALPVTFAVALVASLARVWGAAGVSVGTASLSAFVIALALPGHSLEDALSRAELVVLGGGWAMVVALVLWPLRPYRPARLAIAAAYRALADHVDDVVRGIAAPAEGAETPAGSVRVRAALEDARVVLARMRRGRPGSSGRGERFVALSDIADRIFGHVVGVAENVETIPAALRDETAQRLLADALADVARGARRVADEVELEWADRVRRVPWDAAALRARAAELPEEAATHYRQAATLLERAAQYATAADAAAAESLRSGLDAPADVTRPAADEEETASPLATVRAILSPDSVILGYALRVAVVATAAVGLAALLELPRGYWITITVVVILQPYTGVTTHRALQRVLGTVLGGILTAGLGALFHDPRAVLALAFVFTAVCVALLPLNYAAFSVFLTPTFVLLAEAGAGDWHLAGTRVVNTLLGGLLALLGARLLWPSPEFTRLPGYMAAALRANRDYLRRAAELFEDRSEQASQTLRAARRDVGLATVNVDESFQRLLGEHGDDSATVASALTFIAYTRRLTAATAALALARHSIEGDVGASAHEPAEALDGFARAAASVLDDLAGAVTEHRAPAPLPDVLEARDESLPHLLQARMARIGRHVVMLHDAASRWAAGPGTGEFAVPRQAG
jgi:uncharacterized membrane protein YccC